MKSRVLMMAMVMSLLLFGFANRTQAQLPTFRFTLNEVPENLEPNFFARYMLTDGNGNARRIVDPGYLFITEPGQSGYSDVVHFYNMGNQGVIDFDSDPLDPRFANPTLAPGEITTTIVENANPLTYDPQPVVDPGYAGADLGYLIYSDLGPDLPEPPVTMLKGFVLVPEPSAFALVGAGILSLAGLTRRRRKA